MKAFGIVGPDAEAAARRLAEHLTGRVARVEHAAASADGGAALERPAAATAYTLDEEGWTARGDGLDLDGALDRLAPDHDYAIVTGAPGASLPHVTLGDAAVDGELLHEAPDADSVDVDTVAEALERVEPHETLESLVARVKRSSGAERAGAIATFTGRVREKDGPDDAPTTHLEFEKYEGVAEERMDALEADLEEREGVQRVLMHHRTGVIAAGEDIVFVVVLAGHREEAFATVSDGIDRLKEEVPIFKKEVTVDEEFWVHER